MAVAGGTSSSNPAMNYLQDIMGGQQIPIPSLPGFDQSMGIADGGSRSQGGNSAPAVLQDTLGAQPHASDVRNGGGESFSRPTARPKSLEVQVLHKGGVVKKTGLALVEKGERVIPVAEKEGRAKSTMSGGEKKSGGSKKSGKSEGKSKSKSSSKPKHKVHTMHIKHAENGGWIASHDFQPPEGGGGPEGGGAAPPSEDLIIPPGIGNLQAHVGENMGQEQDEQQQPPPGGGGGPQMPPPGAAMGGGM